MSFQLTYTTICEFFISNSLQIPLPVYNLPVFVFVFFTAPRLLVTVTSVTPTMGTLSIMDPLRNGTAQYYVRYKRRRDAGWSLVKWTKASLKPVGRRHHGEVRGLLPYTNYSLEVAPYYLDNDLGPYSMPLTFVTDEDGE